MSLHESLHVGRAHRAPSPHRPAPDDSLVAILRARAAATPDRLTLRFLTDGRAVGASLDYAELDRRVRALAARLQRDAEPGARALIALPSGPDYVVAFFACLYYPAGRIAWRKLPLDQFARMMTELKAPLGTHAILGNHDWWDDHAVQRAGRGVPAVRRLLEAQGIPVGRTNTPAFSLRWFTTNQLHGDTKNPRDPALTPGGSSGG
uniref:amidase family protein n=1 Tax=Methylobacterium sp. B34 TaxID=95563 RepID=UPI0005B2B12D